MEQKKNITLTYIALVFLKIGSISWGGFMALVSVIQKELCAKDKVVEDGTVLDGVALASVLPGPMAFNVVAYLGNK